MTKVVNAYKNRSRCNTFLRACVGLAGSLNNGYVIFLFQTHLTHLQAIEQECQFKRASAYTNGTISRLVEAENLPRCTSIIVCLLKTVSVIPPSV